MKTQLPCVVCSRDMKQNRHDAEYYSCEYAYAGHPDAYAHNGHRIDVTARHHHRLEGRITARRGQVAHATYNITVETPHETNIVNIHQNDELILAYRTTNGLTDALKEASEYVA